MACLYTNFQPNLSREVRVQNKQSKGPDTKDLNRWGNNRWTVEYSSKEDSLFEFLGVRYKFSVNIVFSIFPFSLIAWGQSLIFLF